MHTRNTHLSLVYRVYNVYDINKNIKAMDTFTRVTGIYFAQDTTIEIRNGVQRALLLLLVLNCMRLPRIKILLGKV